jgi:hypothetical protein
MFDVYMLGLKLDKYNAYLSIKLKCIEYFNMFIYLLNK